MAVAEACSLKIDCECDRRAQRMIRQKFSCLFGSKKAPRWLVQLFSREILATIKLVVR